MSSVHSIFWWHPSLRADRLTFFTTLSAKYSISFLFLPKSFSNFFFTRPVLEHHLRCEYCSERGITRNRYWIFWISDQDIRKLYAGIKNSDIFVSSFVLNIYTVVGLVICKLFRKKLIVWEEIPVISPGLVPAVKYAVMRVICKHVDAFFVMAKNVASAVERLGVSREKIFLTNEYPGQNYQQMKQQEMPSIRINRGDKIILYIGRLVDFKGVDYLIKAFSVVEREFDHVTLLIAGDGPFRTELEALATTIGLKNVFFLGQVRDAEKAYLLAISSVVVAPTIVASTWRSGETTGPLTVLEALSAGKPVITTTVAGTSSFIQNGVNGFVVPQKDASSIAEKIRYLLENDIPPSQVLATFSRIMGVEYQIEQFEKAINYVTQSK